jgi:hypothetical protein
MIRVGVDWYRPEGVLPYVPTASRATSPRCRIPLSRSGEGWGEGCAARRAARRERVIARIRSFESLRTLLQAEQPLILLPGHTRRPVMPFCGERVDRPPVNTAGVVVDVRPCYVSHGHTVISSPGLIVPSVRIRRYAPGRTSRPNLRGKSSSPIAIPSL